MTQGEVVKILRKQIEAILMQEINPRVSTVSTTPKEHSLASQSARTFFLQNK